MIAPVLMLQGTASSVGKSLLTAALCRHYARQGLRVAPFKAQNMSNNAAVTPEGGEIGRAQALQALACGIAPHVDMNPVLLKPEADHTSQVVVLGKARGNLRSADWKERRDALWDVVTGALDRLRDAYDLVIIEGAGSPAEINLREGDIVNMEVALYAKAPVLLIADIDRGGAFASLVGTLALVAPEERALVRGFVMNRFRGDIELLRPGLTMLEARTGVPVVGVVPYLMDLRLPEEDAVALERPEAGIGGGEGALDVAVARFPRIANFDDMDPLRAEPDVRVRWVESASGLGDPDLIVLPGTKATMADLAWLRSTGLAEAIVAARARGSAIIGLCGGYQMLGRWVDDASGIEGRAGRMDGLGLLPVTTVFAGEKATVQAQGRARGGTGLLRDAAGLPVRGYEIHMGRTAGEGGAALTLAAGGGEPEREDGALAADSRVLGTYLHGLFHNDALRRTLLTNIATLRGRPWSPSALEAEPLVETELDRLTDAVAAALDMDAIDELVGVKDGALR